MTCARRVTRTLFQRGTSARKLRNCRWDGRPLLNRDGLSAIFLTRRGLPSSPSRLRALPLPPSLQVATLLRPVAQRKKTPTEPTANLARSTTNPRRRRHVIPPEGGSGTCCCGSIGQCPVHQWVGHRPLRLGSVLPGRYPQGDRARLAFLRLQDLC